MKRSISLALLLLVGFVVLGRWARRVEAQPPTPAPTPLWQISDPYNPPAITGDLGQLTSACGKRAAGLEVGKFVHVQRVN